MGVMRRFFLIFSFMTLLLSQRLFSQQDGGGSDSAEAFSFIPELEPAEVKDIEAERLRVILNTDAKNCRIYLNGNFQGLSKLTVSNIADGYYLLRVEKTGYVTQERFVLFERGKEKSFYVELSPKEGTAAARDSEDSESGQDTDTDAFGDAR